jgi:transposase
VGADRRPRQRGRPRLRRATHFNAHAGPQTVTDGTDAIVALATEGPGPAPTKCGSARRCGRKPHFDRVACRRRTAIERTVGALKAARAVATRYEEPAIRDLALVEISTVRLLVRRPARLLSHGA